MKRQEFIEEIKALAIKAEAFQEHYIAENLRYLAHLIEMNVEGTYISLLTIMKKHF